MSDDIVDAEELRVYLIQVAEDYQCPDAVIDAILGISAKLRISTAEGVSNALIDIAKELRDTRMWR